MINRDGPIFAMPRRVNHTCLSAHAETELIEAARAGDRQALDTLVRRHQPRLEAICRRICEDADEAADVLQDTLLGIAANIGRFRGDSSLLTWAYTIARTHWARRRRGRGRSVETKVKHLRVELSEEVPASEREPFDCLADDELRCALLVALRQLSVLDREVLVLRDVEGFSAAEVAEQLRLSVPAVKTRLHRARVATRERIRDHAIAA
jgi:RNA polymerase sigma-70 factor (ECF subfamily)